MRSWAVFVLFVVAAWLLRRHGESWPATLAKLALLTVLSMVAVIALGVVALRW
jgi:hypothetical protein